MSRFDHDHHEEIANSEKNISNVRVHIEVNSEETIITESVFCIG